MVSSASAAQASHSSPALCCVRLPQSRCFHHPAVTGSHPGFTESRSTQRQARPAKSHCLRTTREPEPLDAEPRTSGGRRSARESSGSRGSLGCARYGHAAALKTTRAGCIGADPNPSPAPKPLARPKPPHCAAAPGKRHVQEPTPSAAVVDSARLPENSGAGTDSQGRRMPPYRFSAAGDALHAIPRRLPGSVRCGARGRSPCLTALAQRLRVRALLLARAHDDVHKPAVVLKALLGAARQLLALLALGDLGGLPTHLTGTSQRAVNLACGTWRRQPVSSRVAKGGRGVRLSETRQNAARARAHPFFSGTESSEGHAIVMSPL